MSAIRSVAVSVGRAADLPLILSFAAADRDRADRCDRGCRQAVWRGQFRELALARLPSPRDGRAFPPGSACLDYPADPIHTVRRRRQRIAVSVIVRTHHMQQREKVTPVILESLFLALGRKLGRCTC